MKRTIAILLALLMVLSLAACGGGGQTTPTPEPSASTPESTPEPTPEPTAEATEAPEITEYAIGEAFGTDSVECVITEVRWMTSEDVTSHPKSQTMKSTSGDYKTLKASDVFPGYDFYGMVGFSSKDSGYPYLCVTFTLKNIGKTIIEGTVKGYDLEPYGNMAVVYGDGYTFNAEEGFKETLEVLGNAFKEGRIINLPSQVLENKEEPLLIKVTLPTSSNDLEDFYVSVR